MTTTRLYKSTDADAPVLSGSAGALNDLLKQCLVGVSGVAYSSGPTEKMAAGWSKAYEDVGTNLVVYRNALAAGGSGCYVRISDNGGGTYGAREAQMIVYNTMSDIDTGTDPTPSPAQRANGLPLRKSVDVSTTARPWVLLADERTFYLCVDLRTANASERVICGAGDFYSHMVADPTPYFAMGLGTDAVEIDGQPVADWINGRTDFVASPNSGIYVGRSYTTAPGSVSVSINSKFPVADGRDGMGGNAAPLGTLSLGGAARYFDPALIVAEGTIRGVMRGMLTTGNNLTASSPGDVLTGITGRPPGSALCVLSAGNRLGSTYNPRGAGRVLVESALAWP